MDKSTSRSEFIEYLYFEINNLRSKIVRPGWTPWAICGSIATLVWILLSQFTLDDLSYKVIFGFLIIGFFIRFFYYSVLQGLFETDTDKKNLHELRFINLSYGRAGNFLLLLQGIFVIFLIVRFSHDVGALFSIVAFIILGGYLFALAMYWVFELKNLPLPINSPKFKKPAVAIKILLTAAIGIIIWRYIDYLMINLSSNNIVDLRVFLIIVAVFYLVLILVSKPRHVPILNSLTRIRKQLAFKAIDIEAAMTQTDIALSGLRTYDVVQRDVSDLLTLYGEASKETTKCLHYLEDMEQLAHLSIEQKEEQSSFIRPLLEAYDGSLERIEDITGNQLPQRFQSLNKKVGWITMYGKVSDDTVELVNKICNVNNEFTTQFKEMSKRFNSIKNTLLKE